jgi:Site-specific recombinases, DNA invertase Pin homologs
MKDNNENKCYHAAIYVRLSKEDGDKVESDSIGNQKDLIRAFVNNKEDIIICSERVDDGFTGVNFDRPSFIAMLEDIKERKINCVIVKDLSRLGRNFIETGKYIEKIFPFMGVRFISVNDDIDSLEPKTFANNLIVPVKNLMNDAYCRDISIKIRSQLDIKRKKGDFIAPFAAYGYLRNPENKNKLIVDELAAPVVQDIFKKKLEGMSSGAIADYLNDNNILSPMEHKRYIGLNYATTFKVNGKAKWTPTAVLRILNNKLYIGTLIQGKKSSPNYKVKKRFDVPTSQWICVENNHESIIDNAAFESVQAVLKADTRTAPTAKTVYPLSGLVFCVDCGSSMIRKNNGTSENPYYYYICSGFKSKKDCSSHSIRAVYLENAVLLALQEHIKNILDLDEILNAIDNIPYTSRQVQKCHQRLAEKKKEYERYENNKMRVYEDFKDGLLDEEDYRNYKKCYDEKSVEARRDIKNIEKEIQKLVLGKTEGQQWTQYFKEHKNIEELTRKLTVQLIKKITVFENQRIHIDFKFQYEYENIFAFKGSV